MFHFKFYETGDLYGLVYTFPERGDGIGMHSHIKEQEHNVIVLSGSMQIYGPDRIWCKTLKTGEMFTPPEGTPHEVLALESDTSILGLFVYGKPADDDVAEEDKTGTILMRPVTLPIVE